MRPWKAAVFCVALGVALAAAYPLFRRPRSPLAPPPPRMTGSAADAGSFPPRARLAVEHATLAVALAEPPERFLAELPRQSRSVAQMDEVDAPFPPVGFVRRRLCVADAQMLARLERAVTAAAAADGAETAEGAYAALLPQSPACPVCARAADWLDRRGQPPAVKALLWRLMARCQRPEDHPRFASAQAPPDAVLLWFAGQTDRAVVAKVRPRAVASLQRLARARRRPDFDGLVRAAAMLGSQDDAATAQALLSLHRGAGDEELRAALGLGMSRLSDPRAQAVHRSTCRLPALEADPRCSAALAHRHDEEHRRERPDVDDAGTPDPLALALAAGELDPPRHLERHPEEADRVRTLLQGCAREELETRWPRTRCLALLASVDRAAARELARSADADAPRLPELRAALERFEDHAGLVTYLHRLGLVADPHVAAEDRRLVTVRDVLEREGRVEQFDAETGKYPNEHDELLGRLAAKTGALGDLLFEEVAPPPDEDGDASGEYVLHAYEAGKRYTVRARNLGDWYDLSSVRGMLNRLLRERDSRVRLVPLPTADQTAAVLIADLSAIEALVGEGLLEVAAASAPAEKPPPDRP